MIIKPTSSGGGGASAAHATTHVTGGTDVIANAVASGNAGLMSGSDKAKLDGITSGAAIASVTEGAGISVTGTATAPIISLEYDHILDIFMLMGA